MKFHTLLIISALSFFIFQCKEDGTKQKKATVRIADTTTCSPLIFSDSLMNRKIYYPETMDTLRGWCQGLKNGQPWQGYVAASIAHDTLLAINLYETTKSEDFMGILVMYFEKIADNTWCSSNEKTKVHYSEFLPGSGPCVSKYYEEDK